MNIIYVYNIVMYSQWIISIMYFNVFVYAEECIGEIILFSLAPQCRSLTLIKTMSSKTLLHIIYIRVEKAR